jgi:hypothetical protein
MSLKINIMKKFLVTKKTVQLQTIEVEADTEDLACDIADDSPYELWTTPSEEIACDVEATEIRPPRTGGVVCSSCGSSNCVSVDNEPLCHNRDWMNDYNMQYDTQLYVSFQCLDCEKTDTKYFILSDPK